MKIKALISNRDYMLDLFIRMAHHSTAIEGNTLSLEQTVSIIAEHYIPEKTSEREFYEIRNYRNLIPFFVESIEQNKVVDNNLIRDFHSILMDSLLYNKGQFKTSQVGIVGANFETTPPYLVPTTLHQWCDNLNFLLENTKNTLEITKIILEKHIKFEQIHPFSDGNGRIGRLLIVYSCFLHNIVPIVFQKEQRGEYIYTLKEENLEKLLILSSAIQENELKRIKKFNNKDKQNIKTKELKRDSKNIYRGR